MPSYAARNALATRACVRLTSLLALATLAPALALPASATSPTVEIVSPDSGSTMPNGTELNLSAVAYDAEDGDLSAAILWSLGTQNFLAQGGTWGPLWLAGRR